VAALIERVRAHVIASRDPATSAGDDFREAFEGSTQSSAEAAVESSVKAQALVDEALAALDRGASELSAYMAEVLDSPGATPATRSSGPSPLRYEASPKHGRIQRGKIGKAPDDGQTALDRSTPISPNTTRRVGVDAANDEIVVFDETHDDSGRYHGHVRQWSELSPRQQAALRRTGLTDRRGRILP
jgi:hypothetical protein